MAVIGETYEAGAVIYSDWMERENENAYFLFELISQYGSGSLRIDLYTKNYEDAGDYSGSAVGTISATTSTALHPVNVTGSLLELVRYKITVGGSAGDWIHYRLVGVAWYVAAS